MNRYDVIVNGVTLPLAERGGISVTPNRIYSSNAGRNSSTGDFIGDVIAVKYTLSLTFPPLDAEQMKTLWNLFSGTKSDHTVQFVTPEGRQRTIVCYNTEITPVMRHFSLREKKAYYEGVTLELIER